MSPRDPKGAPTDAPVLDLEDFLPYRLSVAANMAGRALALHYERRFGLSPAEWRLIANLARFGPLSANGVCERSAMDKVQVSRAVARAVAAGLVDRTVDAVDRRRSVLTLTPAGRALHDQIVPLALGVHEALRAALSDEECAAFDTMLTRIQQCARTLCGADRRAGSGEENS